MNKKITTQIREVYDKIYEFARVSGNPDRTKRFAGILNNVMTSDDETQAMREITELAKRINEEYQPKFAQLEAEQRGGK